MKVLVVDDEENIRRTLRMALISMEQHPFEAPDGETAVKLIVDEGIHVVFLDLMLGPESGLKVLPRLLEAAPNLHVVVFTAHASIETAVQAVKLGATDYLEKPITPDQIRLALSRIENTRKLEDRVAELEARLGEDETDVDANSESPVMRQTYDTARQAAASEANILILGESGTGKTRLAGELHRCSPRQGNKFVTISCPSLTGDLLASELFGHVKGAFTGALQDTWGKVAAADEGSLFLDEIGDLPAELQPKLLRLLQEREYERVGETKTRQADVRVIAASNRDLARQVEAGTFREDLFYRLNVITLRMPPLRERMEDIELLVRRFVKEFAGQCGKRVEGVADIGWARLRNHDWPGNIRELRNLVEREVILSTRSELDFASMEGPVAATGPGSGGKVQVGARVTLEALQEEHLRRIVETSETLEEAAKILGIDPATLYRRRKKMERQRTA